MTKNILAAALAEDISTIVATERDILADLFYSARTRNETVRALAPTGPAPHHYALRFPYAPKDETILIVTRANEPPPCAGAHPIGEIAPETGAYRSHPQQLYRANGLCLQR